MGTGSAARERVFKLLTGRGIDTLREGLPNGRTLPPAWRRRVTTGNRGRGEVLMNQPLDYHNTIAFEGDAGRALQTARRGFSQCSFLVEEDGPEGFTASGPGLHNSRHNPLYAISWVRVRVGEGRIEIEARLGGLRTIRRFIIGVTLAFLIIFLVCFGMAADKTIAERMILPIMSLIAGMLIFPFMLHALRRNTIRNLDRLAGNMAALGAAPESTPEKDAPGKGTPHD